MFPRPSNPPPVSPWRIQPPYPADQGKPPAPQMPQPGFKLPPLPQLGSQNGNSNMAMPPVNVASKPNTNQPTFAQIVQQAQTHPMPNAQQGGMPATPVNPPPGMKPVQPMQPPLMPSNPPPGMTQAPPGMSIPPAPPTQPSSQAPTPKLNMHNLPQLPTKQNQTASIIGSVNAQMMPKLDSSSGMSGLNSVLPGMADPSAKPKQSQPPVPSLNDLSISGRKESVGEAPVSGSSSSSDQSGLKPLIGLIESKDKERQSVILGTDLGMCGLDIANLDVKLAKKFGSPWQELDTQPVVPDFNLPSCYRIDTVVPQQRKLQNFDEGALFYIFYTMPRDAMQEAAAVELTNRSWRYHKELQMWLTKDPLSEPIQTSPQEETGVYIFFDPLVWRKIKREYVLFYPDIAEFVSWKPLVKSP